MKIGYLKPVSTNWGEELHGEIQTLNMQLKVKFSPNRKKSNELEPDFICRTTNANGDISIGGAWEKKKSQIGGTDLEFLSITIDDPSLPNALNVAAFKNKDGGWDITWRRRQDNSSKS